VGEIFQELCRYKGIDILEGHAMGKNYSTISIQNIRVATRYSSRRIEANTCDTCYISKFL
jgi:hypothetical protein